jgi:hypothetical protein
VKGLRSAIERDNAAEIKSGLETVEKAMHELAQVAYQAAGAGGQPGAAPGAGAAPGGEQQPKGKRDDGVIDAEFEDSN